MVDWQANDDASTATRRSLNIKLCTQIFSPRLHIRYSETVLARRLGMSNTGSVVRYLQNEIRRIAAKIHGDDRRSSMAHGVADRLLRNSEQIFLSRGLQTFFGYAG